MFADLFLAGSALENSVLEKRNSREAHRGDKFSGFEKQQVPT